MEEIERAKAWEFVDLDKTTLKTHIGSLKSVVNYAQVEKNREIQNRQKIGDSWSSEVLSLFHNSSRSELIKVVKAVKKYPVYQDARNRINLLIIERLTNKNNKPTPQKVFTRSGDWTKIVSANKVVAKPIPSETLLKPNIRLGPYNVLETSPPPLSICSPSFVSSPDANTTTFPLFF